ncbi:GNAT family N-acetyltransferase [Pseudomonas fluorescens]|uniref:Protein lysine acetyltransferase Pka n=1 Tax=Pseudomonas fluorescens TaxID=294 RepID=A0A5E7AVZ0_PSEFL|nr:GNAT family N-acetyltransferase [Pseudomonas fluorescens]VVN82919.1 Protein lysine acetyltransferase Pka [Pseudomonas fluorescens]
MLTIEDQNTQAAATYAAVPGEHWIEPLSDGRHVLIRPLSAEDREREYNFIKRLSSESRHLRFLEAINEPGTALLDQLMNVDYQGHMAYIALVHENGELLEIGVSRYAAGTGEHQCECAVTVADEWQHLGLGVALMRHLITAARQNDFRQMYSIDSASNTHMRELAHFLGFEGHRDPDNATQVIYRLTL